MRERIEALFRPKEPRPRAKIWSETYRAIEDIAQGRGEPLHLTVNQLVFGSCFLLGFVVDGVQVGVEDQGGVKTAQGFSQEELAEVLFPDSMEEQANPRNLYDTIAYPQGELMATMLRTVSEHFFISREEALNYALLVGIFMERLQKQGEHVFVDVPDIFNPNSTINFTLA